MNGGNEHIYLVEVRIPHTRKKASSTLHVAASGPVKAGDQVERLLDRVIAMTGKRFSYAVSVSVDRQDA